MVGKSKRNIGTETLKKLYPYAVPPNQDLADYALANITNKK